MHRFTVPGAELAWAFSDESGSAVVQLHGLTSSRARDRVLDLDLGRGLSGTRLLRYDARGHGHSSGRAEPEDYRWPSLADDLLRLLDHWFPGERVHGVGPSMGTATLLHAAVREPDRFSGLTLLLPPTAWATRAARAGDYLRMADLIETDGIERVIEEGRDAPRPPATVGHPDTVPDVTAELLPSVLRGAARSDLPAPDALAGIEVPTTVLAWVEDPAHPLSTAEALVELMPRATLQVARTGAEVRRWPGVLAADIAQHSR
ncbi:alpha/beta fold hydrolase [Aeromicrobium duanguangcaii]|uniref:Alpha/beta hydrolase n=1 Tax=Aeromicrobium duanguangcaii TaxID=2968086 RepID=A0ABY5KGK8_9ACTN|nr:alpha/beta hydrolase [Aeromicrobium duanguangcaii]MCD9153289.1 alpha/beta hydrolase [Aeromicrobium duanguangcaii]MCL3836720.1 alpha/beta hydrolase [Aeromicrobium duanguangcaii]UUI69616.1 alpha/beta hydrolase [Aeromicrobium duanguangcaii]